MSAPSRLPPGTGYGLGRSQSQRQQLSGFCLVEHAIIGHSVPPILSFSVMKYNRFKCTAIIVLEGTE